MQREHADRLTRHGLTRRLRAWGRANRRRFPWRTETDPFRILVAEVLLQRSRGRTVAKVYDALFRRWPEPQTLARATVEDITAVIHPLGLTSRAARLREMAERVADQGMPHDAGGLIELPGVGRYAANATAAAMGHREPVVDGTSARVYRRYFGLPDHRPPVDDEALWSLVREVMPRTQVAEWNWAVLDLAAAICMPKRPRCEGCPLVAGCAWASENRRPVSSTT